MTVTACLRLHTGLSDAARALSTPRLLVEELRGRGVSLAALTDVNTALNCPAFAVHCARAGLSALYGMEAVAAGGERVLVLFDDVRRAVDFSTEWHRHLPAVAPVAEQDGDQFVLDGEERIIARVPKRLSSCADVAVPELERAVLQAGGLPVPGAACACGDELCLDTGELPLVLPDGRVSLQAVRAGLARRGAR